jgi:predicted aspartyl protease
VWMRRNSIVIFVLTIGLTGLLRADDQNSVPFRLHGRSLIVVKGSMGPLRNLTFLVDTGTSRTMVRQGVARKLGLTGQPAKVWAFSQVVEVERALLPELRLGPLHVTDNHVLIADFTNVERSLGIRVDGIIGMDVLGNRCFRVDYKSRRLRFGRRQQWQASAPFAADTPYLVVAGTIDNRRLRLLVDTGADHIVLFAEQLDAGWRDSLLLPGAATATQMTGATELRPTRTVQVNIGDGKARPLNVFVLQVGEERYPYDGVLGVRALRSAQVQFDFENMQLSWEP